MSAMSVEEIVAIAASGYPPGQATPLMVSQHGDHAAVLLETGSGLHSLPYFTLCRRDGGEWVGVQASNMGGWYQTEDDAGVVVFWDDAEGLPEPIEVEFNGQRWKAETNGTVAWAIWWDELNPANYIDPTWPALARR
jgi:hypothetical protein